MKVKLKRMMLSVRVPTDVREKLKRMAEWRCCSMAHVITEMIREQVVSKEEEVNEHEARE